MRRSVNSEDVRPTSTLRLLDRIIQQQIEIRIAMKKRSTEIKGKDITRAQIASANDFLTAMGWKDTETIRGIKRADVALLIAWYGALRYQAAIDHVGTLINPGRLVESTPRSEKPQFEIMEIADVITRSLVE
jgi:hypothetical protein